VGVLVYEHVEVKGCVLPQERLTYSIGALVEGAFSDTFKKMKDGDFETQKDAETLYKKLLSPLKLLHLEESLKTALSGVATKKPEARGAFDNTVVDELEKSFGVKLAELNAVIEAGRPESEARAAAVAEAADACEAAKNSQSEATQSLLNAKEAQKEAAASLQAAKKAVADYEPQYQAATEQRDSKVQEMQEFVDGAMATFDQLKERLSAKKLREQAAEAKAAAAAEAEAAAAAEAEAAAAAEAKAAAAAETEEPAATA